MTPEEKERSKNRRRRITVSLSVFLTACAIILFYFTILRFHSFAAGFEKLNAVLMPIVLGFIMAFIMNPFMKFFERSIFKAFKKHSKSEEKAFKRARSLSAILALLILLGILVLFAFAIVPELYTTVRYLVDNIEYQIAGVLDWCNDITKGQYEEALMNAKESKIDTAIETGIEYAQKYLNYDKDQLVDLITSGVLRVGKGILNFIIACFVSVYVLIDKEKFKGQAKKIICGICPAEHANIVLEVTRKSADIFYGFITGKIIDSVIIGIICYIVCLIMSMPYALLVSVIVGITNIIPVFGPYIGAIPTVIIIFLTEPGKGIAFLIFVLILQQFDGNWLGPKILGNQTGISSFWVVVAVVVGGGLFGVLGMIVGVPVVAILYYLGSRYSKYLLNKRGLPIETEKYVRMEEIDLETNTLRLRSEEEEVKRRNDLFKNSPLKENNKDEAEVEATEEKDEGEN